MYRFRIDSPHRLYPSLCNPCGEFNISSSILSLSSNLDLKEKTALVTGGRINLGYHTALRLLRCGANVVVSTRYPIDAEKRYLNEADSDQWKAHLKIVGADFWSAKDIFALINAVLSLLRSWANGGKAKLDILINNTVQTLTDSVEKEDEHIERESQLKNTSSSDLLLEAGYSPRVRCSQPSNRILCLEDSTSQTFNGGKQFDHLKRYKVILGAMNFGYSVQGCHFCPQRQHIRSFHSPARTTSTYIMSAPPKLKSFPTDQIRIPIRLGM